MYDLDETGLLACRDDGADGETVALHFVSASSRDAYERVLRSVGYLNRADEPHTGARRFAVEVVDATGFPVQVGERTLWVDAKAAATVREPAVQEPAAPAARATGARGRRRRRERRGVRHAGPRGDPLRRRQSRPRRGDRLRRRRLRRPGRGVGRTVPEAVPVRPVPVRTAPARRAPPAPEPAPRGQWPTTPTATASPRATATPATGSTVRRRPRSRRRRRPSRRCSATAPRSTTSIARPARTPRGAPDAMPRPWSPTRRSPSPTASAASASSAIPPPPAGRSGGAGAPPARDGRSRRAALRRPVRGRCRSQRARTRSGQGRRARLPVRPRPEPGRRVSVQVRLSPTCLRQARRLRVQASTTAPHPAPCWSSGKIEVAPGRTDAAAAWRSNPATAQPDCFGGGSLIGKWSVRHVWWPRLATRQIRCVDGHMSS